MCVSVKELSFLKLLHNECVNMRTKVLAVLHHKCVSKVISVLAVLRHKGVNKRTKFSNSASPYGCE